MKKYLGYIAGFSALLLIAPASVVIEPVDVSLQTMVILCIGGIFQPRVSALMVAGYILLGALGLPVFSGYVGGYEKLLGPTAGFFVGFLVTAPLVSNLIPKVSVSFFYYTFIFILSHILILMPGFVWLSIQLPDVDLMEVLIPLFPGLFIKSCAAGGFVFGIRKGMA